MVIYDKNQFAFNIIFVLILVGSAVMTIVYSRNFEMLGVKYQNISDRLAEVESNQAFNFIQGSHIGIEYQLNPQGFYVLANDYGVFNGPSMQPAIFDGNTLVERKFDGKSKLAEGQIIRFMRDDGTAVIHRVRSDYGDKVFVQGDSLKEGEIIEKARITHLVIGVLFT